MMSMCQSTMAHKWLKVVLATSFCVLGQAELQSPTGPSRAYEASPPPPTTCIAQSLASPHLRLTSFRRTMPHTTESVDGVVEFDLYNPMNNSTAHCAAKYRLPSASIPATSCAPAPVAGRDLTATSFSLDNSAGDGRLQVRQTWICVGSDGASDKQYVGLLNSWIHVKLPVILADGFCWVC
ncbi:hypothetical protein B0T24DRAFT_610406 [Lasiosphaeria ovina]|uniref:AA1-like domain-containing protein n=1 Tax=Lasiosphaeria ovina TaxID=92902 RepID=A0AAE0NDH8_9PEZI|nr:hypothetical protein B0T24DRAFT_610406 [Lasiosphaeria ovina]